MQPTKNASVGDVFRVTPSPFEPKTSPEMGHFIREARKLTRNNTFIGLEAAKGDGSERIRLNLNESWNRWSSAENLAVNRSERSAHNRARVAPLKLAQFTIGPEPTEDDNSGAKEKQPNDRRCSMIPLMCQPAGRPKVSHAPAEREKMRKTPPIPPKAPAKHHAHIKIYRTERLQEKKMDMEQQLEDIREKFAGAARNGQRDSQHIREILELLKKEVDDLKSTCAKLTEAVQQLKNSDDLFLKMKHEGEFSFYSRSYEVSKKILSNTFRRRKSNSARSTNFEPHAGTGGDPGASSDTATTSQRAIEQPVVSDGGDDHHRHGRPSSAPEPPRNVVTSLYYVSEIQSLEMDDVTQERNDPGNPSFKTTEQDLLTKKKTKMSKIAGWFKSDKR
ncbi:uncharacterized protein LOC128712376 [Anopheles marshallii]|uniref:uncharacterized protein LOC128712376 n=1 Tax=Anopheles marshallii TaxID=1521116 RepID=UPI00237B0337|nr:uncharacterized protein LOC128712376 [Anopheles marshallii]